MKNFIASEYIEKLFSPIMIFDLLLVSVTTVYDPKVLIIIDLVGSLRINSDSISLNLF